MKFLIIEDDSKTSDSIQKFLETNFSHQVETAFSGTQGKEYILNSDFSIALIDGSLPGIDGLSLLFELRQLKANSLFVYLGSDKSYLEESVCYKAGADVYHPKPVRFSLLGYQLTSLTRRLQVLEKENVFDKDLLLRSEEKLTKREREILTLLIKSKGKIIKKEELGAVTKRKYVTSTWSAVDTIVSRIRAKIGRDNIETIYGIGYRWKS